MAMNDAKGKFSLSRILANNKALAVISFLLAVVVWLSISINQSPEIERVIENVKVTIDDSVPSQLGYEAFGTDDVYVDITVKGKRYIVGSLDADDFKVTAITTHVDSPGVYSLQLKATSNDAEASYTIESKSMDNLEVYFDTPKTVEVLVETNIECESDNLIYSDEYITADPILSSEKIKITGPTTEVEKISKVVATVKTKGNLKSTETLEATLTVADAYGAEIKYLTLDDNAKNLTITIPVYTATTLPATVDLTNVPAEYLENPPIISCSPSEISVGVDAKKLKGLDEISIGTIDWNDLTVGVNTFTLEASGMTDGIPLVDGQTVTVVITVEDLSEE